MSKKKQDDFDKKEHLAIKLIFTIILFATLAILTVCLCFCSTYEWASDGSPGTRPPTASVVPTASAVSTGDGSSPISNTDPMYNVTFLSHCGFDVPAQKVESGNFASLPSVTLLKTGYDFLGWDFDFATPITQDTVVNARWQLITYNISYVLNDGINDSSNPATYTVEDSITLALPTKNGYTGSWSDSGVIPAGSTGDKTFTASWTPISYNINYVLNNGDNNASNPTTYTIEDAITLLEPTRAGYSFAGWSDGGVIPVGSTGDKTFTASWSVITYNINYILNGGTNDLSNPTTYTVEDATITLAPPTKDGYTGSWSGGGIISAGSTGDMAFTAIFDIVEYNITYVLGDGGINNAGNPSKYTVADSTITLLDPTRTGYNFAGWSDGGVISAGSTGDKTFTANWTPINYSINYVLNEGTNNASNPTTYTIEDAITLLNPTRIGYDFVGWSDGGVISAGSTGDKTFTANWTATNYNINYVLNGGTNDLSNPTTYTIEDGTITLALPTRNGYTGVWDSGGVIPAGSIGNITFTAVWTPINYNINYVLNNGDNNVSNPTTYTVEDAITLLEPTRAGYSFAGWSDGGVIPVGSTGDKTFTASWTLINYNINYVLNGGDNPASNPTTYTVEDGTITLAPPTLNAYTGVWSGGGVIPAGSTGDKTFTAVYEAVEYTITYILGNGGINNASNPATYTIESATITLLDPTRTGYNFVGWDNGGTIPAGSIGDVTFTANWTPISYNINYVLNGGTNNASNPATYTVEDTVTLLMPTKTNESFEGWENGDGVIITEIPSGTTGDITLTATWSTPDVKFALKTDGTYEVIGLNTDKTDIVIPSTFNGVPVTSIKRESFYNTNLTSVVVEDGIKTIEQSAFSRCASLVSVSLPDDVTFIGDATFADCVLLATINIPSGLTVLNERVFSNTALTSVVIPNGIEIIDQHAFALCKNLKSVTVPDSVTVINHRAFIECSALDTITLSENLETIGSWAFARCSSLTSIVIPESVTSIKQGAFEDCSSLKNVTLPSHDHLTLENGTFNKCSSLESITIPNGMTSIANDMFKYCGNLSSVTIPDTVTSIGYSAFEGCASLKAIDLPSDISIIRGSTFKGTGLESIVIPSSVTKIESSVFANCGSLTSIVIPNTVTEIGQSAFENSGLTSITLSSNITVIAQGLFKNTSLVNIVIPNGVTEIKGSAFADCSDLVSVSIPESVTSIESYVFRNCTSLKNVNIPSLVTTLNFGVFIGCTSLESIVLPTGLVSIGQQAFDGCRSLYDINFPSSLTSIGNSAFNMCTSLQSVTLPASLTRIENRAFFQCSSLTSVTFAEPNGWSAGSTPLLSTDLSNASTAATYLISTAYYTDYTWTRT